MNPIITTEAIERLLSAFLAGRGPHTVDAYQRDLTDFCIYLRRAMMGPSENPIGQGVPQADALRWYFRQPPGRANELALHYRHDLLSRGRSTSTTARRLSVIKSLAKYGRMTGLITFAIETPSVRIEKTRDTRGPQLETIRAMLAVAARQPDPIGSRDVAVMRLAFDLALRIGELVRLDVADLNLKHGTVWIFGKGRRAKELVTMPPACVEAVRAWLNVRGSKPGPLLLSYSRSKAKDGRLVTRGIYRIIRDLGAAAGEHVRPHGIRHTAITQAIDAAAEQGLSIDVVRQFSRHRSLNTLMIYRDMHENKQAVLSEWVSGRVPTPDSRNRAATRP